MCVDEVEILCEVTGNRTLLLFTKGDVHKSGLGRTSPANLGDLFGTPCQPQRTVIVQPTNILSNLVPVEREYLWKKKNSEKSFSLRSLTTLLLTIVVNSIGSNIHWDEEFFCFRRALFGGPELN